MSNVRKNNRITGRIIASLKRRIKQNGGFSLAETLLAVLILLLVSVIVATGMPAATNAYNKVVLGANAKVMLSTAITALHDEIGTAWKVENSTDHKSLTYFNASTGAKSTLSLDTNGAIQIQDYLSLSTDLIHEEGNTEGTAHHLVGDSNSDFYVTYDTITYNAGIVSIEDLAIYKKTDTTNPIVQYTGEDGTAKEFKIRVISNNGV